LKAITIVGGADAGWLAALSQWLCDCKVKVTRGDGSVLYQNVQDDENVQLNFIFRTQEQTVKPESLASDELKLYDKTFVLDDVSQIFRDEGRWLDGHVVSGRVTWDHALSKAFISDFRKLIEMSFALGLVIGSAARIFGAIAASDHQIPLKYRAACSSYCINSFGAGFIMNTIFWFPELAKLQKHMEKVSAQCVNGICAFLAILKDPSDESETVGRIHVLPGRIDIESKSYAVLEDQRLTGPDRTDFASVLKHGTQVDNNQKLRLRVKEGSNSLQCLLEVPVDGLHSPSLVGPAKLASMLASTRGWVSCNMKGKCRKISNVAETLNLANGISEVPHNGIYLSTFKSTSSTHTLLALASASSLARNCSVYLVDEQCHDCCVRAAVGIDRPEERNHFCFLRQRG